MPLKPEHPHTPPVELDGNLTADDIAYELAQLSFHHGRIFHSVKLDEDVRDYQVRRLGTKA